MVWGRIHMVKQMNKEIKGTGLHVNVADQNSSLAMPALFITICPPLLAVSQIKGSLLCMHRHVWVSESVPGNRPQVRGLACLWCQRSEYVHTL